MNAEDLLSIYDDAVDTPDAAARLRRFVLDLAVRGKLVEQDPNDEPASALLKRITAEKARLTRKIRVSRTSVTDPDSAHQLPFNLPAGWARTTIGGISSKTGSGSTPRGGKNAYTERGIVFLRSQNIHNDGLRLTDVAYIDLATHKRMSGTAVRPLDLLLNITGGSIGRCCLVPDDLGQANISQHVSIIRIAINGPQRFLHYVILAPYFQAFIHDEQTGAGRGGLPKYKMDRIPVALPPLAEQHRIVAKVDELMALCDHLEKARLAHKEARAQLTKTTLALLSEPEADTATFRSHARFAIEALPALTARADQVTNLRQTILNLAVRGKIEEQDPADGPASELLQQIEVERTRVPSANKRKFRPLESEAKDGYLFDLPTGWMWVPLAGISDVTMGQSPPSKTYNKSGDGVPLINGPVEFTNGPFGRTIVNQFTTAPTKQCEEGDLLICVRGSTTGRTNVAAFRACIGRGVAAIRSSFEDRYVRLFLWNARNDIISMGRGIAFPSVSKKQLENLPISLPPLAEQHRIVAKVDELMALCDRLEAGLTSASAIRSHLLESVIHEALHDAIRDQ